MNENIYNELIKLLKTASEKGEVPVAAIIAHNDKIIAKKYNRREKNNNVLGHAEVECIRNASKKMKTWKLDECDIYVTLKPCNMCMEVIRESRIKNVYYIVDKLDYKKEYNEINVNKIDNDNLEKIIKNEMNNFFKKKRK